MASRGIGLIVLGVIGVSLATARADSSQPGAWTVELRVTAGSFPPVSERLRLECPAEARMPCQLELELIAQGSPYERKPQAAGLYVAELPRSEADAGAGDLESLLKTIGEQKIIPRDAEKRAARLHRGGDPLFASWVPGVQPEVATDRRDAIERLEKLRVSWRERTLAGPRRAATLGCRFVRRKGRHFRLRCEVTAVGGEVIRFSEPSLGDVSIYSADGFRPVELTRPAVVSDPGLALRSDGRIRPGKTWGFEFSGELAGEHPRLGPVTLMLDARKGTFAAILYSGIFAP